MDPNSTQPISENAPQCEDLPPRRKADELVAIESRIKANLTSVRSGVEAARKVGYDLIRAKSLISHGEWLSWLKRNFDLSARQATRYMAAARGNQTRASDLNSADWTGRKRARGPLGKHGAWLVRLSKIARDLQADFDELVKVTAITSPAKFQERVGPVVALLQKIVEASRDARERRTHEAFDLNSFFGAGAPSEEERLREKLEKADALAADRNAPEGERAAARAARERLRARLAAMGRAA